MPLSKPCPGIERKVIALACVAITDRPIVPPRGPAALQVGIEAPNLIRTPRTVRSDAAQGSEEHHPICDVHEKIRANTASRTTTRTKHPNTNRYTPRHVWNPGRPGGSASDRWSGGNGPVIYPRRGD